MTTGVDDENFGSGDGQPSRQLSNDGEGQPRLFKVHPPIRGMELDAEALNELAAQSLADAGGDADQYLGQDENDASCIAYAVAQRLSNDRFAKCK